MRFKIVTLEESGLGRSSIQSLLHHNWDHLNRIISTCIRSSLRISKGEKIPASTYDRLVQAEMVIILFSAACKEIFCGEVRVSFLCFQAYTDMDVFNTLWEVLGGVIGHYDRTAEMKAEIEALFSGSFPTPRLRETITRRKVDWGKILKKAVDALRTLDSKDVYIRDSHISKPTLLADQHNVIYDVLQRPYPYKDETKIHMNWNTPYVIRVSGHLVYCYLGDMQLRETDLTPLQRMSYHRSDSTFTVKVGLFGVFYFSDREFLASRRKTWVTGLKPCGPFECTAAYEVEPPLHQTDPSATVAEG